MADERREKETAAEQLLGKKHVPHKFCPYCGTRNEANADKCEHCGKDISWMRIPEPIPHLEAPPEKPRQLPGQQSAFTLRAKILIGVLILLLITAVVLLVVFSGSKSKGAAVSSHLFCAGGTCACCTVSSSISTGPVITGRTL